MIDFITPDPKYNAMIQQEILLDIVSPLLRRRYKEKFDALHVGSDWLKEAHVSPPIEYKGTTPQNSHYNTKVEMRFPQKHPLFKGDLGVLYQRVSFDEYFPEVEDEIKIFYEDLLGAKYQQRLDFWLEELIKHFGNYFRHFAKCVYNHKFDRTYKIVDKHVIVEVPNLSILREYFDFGLFKQNEGEFDIIVHVNDSYTILPITKQLKVKVVRREEVDTTIVNKDFPHDRTAIKSRHHAHNWFGN